MILFNKKKTRHGNDMQFENSFFEIIKITKIWIALLFTFCVYSMEIVISWKNGGNEEENYLLGNLLGNLLGIY